MAYHIYETEGLIFESIEQGEASNKYAVMTPNYGLIWVYAQGVRKLSSKLRYSLANFSSVDLHLIRGKSSWKIIHVNNKHNYSNNFIQDTFKINILSRLINLSKSLMPYEGGEEGIFDVFKNVFKEIVNLKEEDKINFEIYSAMMILNSLGYLDSKVYFKDDSWDWKLHREEVEKQNKIMIDNINKSLKSSHLL